MVDLKEERQYKRLKELGQKLGIPVPEAFLTLEVLDRDGKLIQRHRQRSHSWVRNAYNVIFCQLAGKDADDVAFGAGKLCQKDTTGILREGDYPAAIAAGTGSAPRLATSDGLSAGASNSGYRVAASEDGWGIIVGSGINVESFEDYVLQTPIAEGAGPGQLSHAQSEDHSISYAALVMKNELVRYFNNNSGGNVSVNEVALVAGAGGSIASTNKVLMSRDKLASTVTIPDTGQLRVTYTIQLTYPS